MKKNLLVNDIKLKQSNVVTEAYYDFTACQLDIVFMLLAHLKKDDDPEKVYNIHVQDIEAITGRKWNYSRIDTATDDLMSRVYKIPGAKGLKKLTLFSYLEYIDGTGSFDVVINKPARHLFFNLKNNYTLLELKSVLACKSKHAKRIYSLACRWRGIGGKTYDIGQFKEMLGLKDPEGKLPEQYTEITMFKKQVLDVAVTQINENTDVTFEYKLLKRGRSFEKITLFCGVAKPTFVQKEINFQKTPDELLKISAIEALDISKDMAEKIALKCWKEFVKVKNDTLDAVKKGKIIDHKGKYIIGILQKKGLIEKKIK